MRRGALGPEETDSLNYQRAERNQGRWMSQDEENRNKKGGRTKKGDRVKETED